MPVPRPPQQWIENIITSTLPIWSNVNPAPEGGVVLRRGVRRAPIPRRFIWDYLVSSPDVPNYYTDMDAWTELMGNLTRIRIWLRRAFRRVERNQYRKALVYARRYRPGITLLGKRPR